MTHRTMIAAAVLVLVASPAMATCAQFAWECQSYQVEQMQREQAEQARQQFEAEQQQRSEDNRRQSERLSTFAPDPFEPEDD